MYDHNAACCVPEIINSVLVHVITRGWIHRLRSENTVIVLPFLLQNVLGVFILYVEILQDKKWVLLKCVSFSFPEYVYTVHS